MKMPIKRSKVSSEEKHLRSDQAFEERAHILSSSFDLKKYKVQHDGYRCHLLPRVLASILVAGGTLLYGKNPSYLKFRAVEVIARVPYHSWQGVGFLLLTLFYQDEKRALQLAKTAEFARIAQDNETMHVVVISALAEQEERSFFLRDTVAPLCFAFFYFIMSWLMYLLKRRWSFELNYLFEQHAFDQYELFLQQRKKELLQKRVLSTYLSWYGRHPSNQYEFFVSIRNDEIIHRNDSIDMIVAMGLG